MVSQLEKAITAHRRAIRSIDRAALLRVYLAHQQAMETINPLIERLQAKVNELGTLTPSELFRLERYQELQRQLDAEMRRLAASTGEITTEAQRRAVVVALDHAETIATATAATRAGAAVIASSWVRVPFSAVQDFIGATQAGPLAELLASFETVAGQVVVKEITDGLTLGRGPRAVADAITKATDIARNRALTISRTEMLRSMRGATLTTYNDNRDILSGWIWTAAISSNTCGACLAMDGSFHELSESMDSHPNCRCAMRPALKDVPMRKVETGAQWFGKQSPETQDAVLGKSGGAAYRAGEVELHDFIRISESQEWGRSISDGGIGWARQNAADDRRVAA